MTPITRQVIDKGTIIKTNTCKTFKVKEINQTKTDITIINQEEDMETKTDMRTKMDSAIRGIKEIKMHLQTIIMANNHIREKIGPTAITIKTLTLDLTKVLKSI